MNEYVIYESHDLGFIINEVYENLLHSYSSGCTKVRIFVRSALVVSYLKRWMPGWARRAGPGGLWVDSQGNLKIFQVILCDLVFSLGVPVKHQFIMKKIHKMLRREGVCGYRGGSISLDLVMDSAIPFPLECKFI